MDDDFEPWIWDSGGWEMNFVAQMKARREAKGWSQTEFAKLLAAEGLKFHQPTVQRIERGERPLKLTEALVISEVLDTRLEVMLRAASVPMIYDELADYLSADAFNRQVRDVERLEEDIEGNISMVDELLESYREAVNQSADYAVDPRLISVAEEFRRLNAELAKDVETVVLLARAASRTFSAAERDYPLSLRGSDE